MRRLGLFGDRCADAVGHAVDALAERLVELRLPRAENLGHGGDPPLHLRLGRKQHRHLFLPFFVASVPPPRKRHQKSNDDDKAGGNREMAESDRQGTDEKQRLGEGKGCRFHALNLTDSLVMGRSKQEHSHRAVNAGRCGKGG
ncbi:hypothetical protein D9M70_498130 [compost metagenome]